MTEDRLDATEAVLRDGWAVGNPITKIDMEFLASAADEITTIRAQLADARAEANACGAEREAWKTRADLAEASLAAQIETDAGICETMYGSAAEFDARDCATAIRAQLTNRHAPDAAR